MELTLAASSNATLVTANPNWLTSHENSIGGGIPSGVGRAFACGGAVTGFGPSLGLLAAINRSAAEPCLSPLVSFLYAYETLIGLLHKNCPFIADKALSEASKESYEMKPKPRDW